MLAPSHGYTSVDQPCPPQAFKNSLVYCLESFISGVGENPREVFQVLVQSILKVMWNDTQKFDKFNIFFDRIKILGAITYLGHFQTNNKPFPQYCGC